MVQAESKNMSSRLAGWPVLEHHIVVNEAQGEKEELQWGKEGITKHMEPFLFCPEKCSAA